MPVSIEFFFDLKGLLSAPNAFDLVLDVELSANLREHSHKGTARLGDPGMWSSDGFSNTKAFGRTRHTHDGIGCGFSALCCLKHWIHRLVGSELRKIINAVIVDA